MSVVSLLNTFVCMTDLVRDSWKPKVFGGSPSQVAAINHGTYFYHAAMEGLLKNDTNIHAGIRTTLSGPSDYENDGYCGFEIVEAREIDVIGMVSYCLDWYRAYDWNL